MEDENKAAENLSLSIRSRICIISNTLFLLFVSLLSAKAQEPSFTTTNPTTGLCAPTVVEFQIGNWFNNSAGTIYIIDFGDGSPNISLLYPLNATNTTYLLNHPYTKSSCPNQNDTATLEVINGPDTATYALDLIIRQKPIADFSMPATCANTPICFTNQTQNGYVDNSCSVPGLFKWDFGDGNISTEINPCHTYTAVGTYSVTLNVSNTACGSDVIKKDVIVKPTSPSPVPIPPPAYCQNQQAVPLIATGVGLLWYTGSTAGVGSTTTPTPPTNVAGTRTYYVSQTLPGNCESPRVPITVTVNAMPTATIKYLNSPYCRSTSSSQQVSFSGTQGGVYSSSQGLFINATTGAINPSLSTPGAYAVTYTIAASPPCPGYTATTGVNIIENPVLTFSKPDQSICSSGTAVFSFSSVTVNTTYAWSVVGSLPANVSGVSSGTSSDANPSISLSFSNTGTESQTLTIRVTPTSSQSLCVSAPYNITLVVNPAPAALSPETFNLCTNTIPAPALKVDPSPGNTIKWYDNNLGVINIAPVINTSVPAELVYYVSQLNSYGCESPKTKILAIIHPTPTKPVITAKTPVCVGDDLILQAYNSITDDAVDYVWKGPAITFSDNSSNVGIANVTINDAGTYTVTARSQQTGCSDSSDIVIQIGDYPIVKFAQDTVTLPVNYNFNLVPVITNAAAPDVLPIQSYTWTPSQDLAYNDMIGSSAVATIKTNICYTVSATNVYGCSGSATICIRSLCQNSQVFVPNAFTPTGNVPENRKLIVRAAGINMVKSFRIFNRWGRIVFEKNNFPPNSPDFGWDGYINGRLADVGVYIYMVDVVCDNGITYSYKGNVTLL